MADVIIPAQIRAARALLNWSQEDLAQKAEIALSSVRELETERRTSEAGTIGNVRNAFEEAGVNFVEGTSNNGPGVRLVGNRPYLIRRPSTVTKWDGVPLEVEFKGKAFTAFVSREAIEDLGSLRGTEPEKVWLEVAEKHLGHILDAIILAHEAGDRWNERRHLIVGSKHFRKLTRQ
jgi:transcriptional regulator with XRE-family HTH domain